MTVCVCLFDRERECVYSCESFLCEQKMADCKFVEATVLMLMC